jgi:hypothetical protein
MRGDSGVAVSPELASLGGGVETRDVSTNDAWAARHAMEVPVLALSFRAEGDGDGEEEEEEEEIDPAFVDARPRLIKLRPRSQEWVARVGRVHEKLMYSR